MGSRRTFAGWLGRWPWFADSRADHAPNQGVNYACLAAAATPRVAYSSVKPSPSHTAGGITMGYAKYIGRVGALAVALGVGGAIATGQGLGLGVAWADDSGSSSTDSSSTDSSSTDSPTATSSAGATGSASSPGPPRVGSLRPVPAGPNRPPLSRSPVLEAGSQRNGTKEPGSPTSHPDTGSAPTDTPTAGDNTTTTPGDSDAQPGVPAGEPQPDTNAAPAHDAPAQESVATNPPPDSPQAPAPQHTPTAVGAKGSADGSALITHGQAAHTATAPATADAQTPTPRGAAKVLRQRADDTISTASQTMGVEAADTAQMAISAYPATSAPTPATTQAVQPASMTAPVTPATTIASGLLAAVGLTSLAPGPGAPVEPPAMWAMLAFARRQPPARQVPALAPMQTSQDLDGTVDGTFGGADPNSDRLTYRATATGTGAPAYGAVTIDQAAGTFTYTPDDGYVRTRSIHRHRQRHWRYRIPPQRGRCHQRHRHRHRRAQRPGTHNRRRRHPQRRPQRRPGVQRGRHPRLSNHLRLRSRHSVVHHGGDGDRRLRRHCCR